MLSTDRDRVAAHGNGRARQLLAAANRQPHPDGKGQGEQAERGPEDPLPAHAFKDDEAERGVGAAGGRRGTKAAGGRHDADSTATAGSGHARGAGLEVGDVQFYRAFAPPRVAVDGIGQGQRLPVLGHEGGPFGAAPGHRPEHATALLHVQAEVALFQDVRAADHLDVARLEDRPRVGETERRHRLHPGHDLADQLVQRQDGVEAQSGHQVVRLQALVGQAGHPGPEGGQPAAVQRQPGGLPVSAVAAEQVGAALERPQHVEGRDAAARALDLVAVDRQHDGRLVEVVDELGGDDADDAAMPALPRHDDDVVRADVGIGLDQLAGLGDDRRFLFLALRVLDVELLGEPAGLVPGSLVRGEQQPGGDVRRGHAAGRVDARRQQEADVEAVERLAGQSRPVEQRPQPDRVLVLRQALAGRAGR